MLPTLFLMAMCISSNAQSEGARAIYDAMLKREMEQAELSKKNNAVKKDIIDGLREEVANFNRNAPVDFGNDVYMTSASVSDYGHMTIRVTSKSTTRFQVNPALIKEKLTQLACEGKAISRGFNAGLSASMLLTTVDGFDVNTGVINKTACSKYNSCTEP
ncbi:hypothetical protein ACK31O_08875 [Aeromonas caviae]